MYVSQSFPSNGSFIVTILERACARVRATGIAKMRVSKSTCYPTVYFTFTVFHRRPGSVVMEEPPDVRFVFTDARLILKDG